MQTLKLNQEAVLLAVKPKSAKIKSIKASKIDVVGGGGAAQAVDPCFTVE